MQKRGQLTQRIKDRAIELLGYEIDRTELRLMPYIIYVMMNEQKIDPRKCNQDDRDILQKWKKQSTSPAELVDYKSQKRFGVLFVILFV